MHILHYFVGNPLQDSQLSTKDLEPVGMSIIQTLAFSNVVIQYYTIMNQRNII